MSRGRNSHGSWRDRRSPEERELDAYTTETVCRAPSMPNPLPGEREAWEAGQPWDIRKVLAEIEKLKPAIEFACKSWYAQRRGNMPAHLRELQERTWVEAAAQQHDDSCGASRPSKGPRVRATHIPRAPTRCPCCGTAVAQPATGRRRVYCSKPCAKRAERHRRKENRERHERDRASSRLPGQLLS